MTEATLEWLRRAQHPGGAIPAWLEGAKWGPPYLEVTGYVIPTLLAWGEPDMARAAAEYLLAVQRVDGAFPGLDGLSRSFDTAACYEGLMAAWRQFRDARYNGAATRARQWLKGMVREDGALQIAVTIEATNVYTCRADGLLRREQGLKHWTPDGEWHPGWGMRERVHYIAYGLEGLWRGGIREPVIAVLEASKRVIRPDGLMPFYVTEGWFEADGSCLTATAQMAMLYRWAGMDAGRLMEAVTKARLPDGGLTVSLGEGAAVSWGAKWFLDAVKAEAQ
ncbi:MAG: hypothetical protein MUP64_12085 [Anaerolineae bacterium]|nr:hypothetical protein [Anaerolineae bacterium]